MGVYHQYHSKKYPNSSSSSSSSSSAAAAARLLHLAVPSTSNFQYDKSDFIWSNPTELDLLNLKKAPRMISSDENHFLKVRPCIRRLYTAFNSICPNIYRIHCSDSLRILQELICLIEEYLHIQLPLTTSPQELLSNDQYLDSLIEQLRYYPSYQFYPHFLHSPTLTPQIRCFGRGIRTCDYQNQLNENLLFCFEMSTSRENPFPSSIEVLILDPNEMLVVNQIKHIHTYDRGQTKLFSCSYKPSSQAGTYHISFISNRMPLTDEPFNVYIRNSNQEKETNRQVNESKIPMYELEGDGYSKKVIVNSITRFRLRMNNTHSKCSLEQFSASIIDPYGHPIVVQRRILSSDLLELTYQPMSIGEHQLTIAFNNQIHRQIVLQVIQDETNYLSKFKPFGPGLHRAIVGLPTEFYVDLNQQTTFNQHPIQFSLEPSYQAEIDYEQQMATVRYTPHKHGDCPIHILESGRDISQSPFHAQIKQEVISNESPRIRVKGLTEQIIIHRPVEFRVFIENPFDDPMHTVHVEILTDETSPSVSIRREDSSTYHCSFLPTKLGRHFISIDYAGIVAENNPFNCQVIQDKDIQLTGPAINTQCLTLNEPTHFYFKLNDFLNKSLPERTSTYESGYSSNEDTSLTSSVDSDRTTKTIDEEDHYRVTITDGHGNIKPNVSIQSSNENRTDQVRVDFTPDEQILFINISCTW